MTTYLDHAASTPMLPAAVEVMHDLLQRNVGNPTGAHRIARESRRILDDTRDIVAETMGCEPGDVIFTGGGTEADNLAIFGTSTAERTPICSAIEHPAVLQPVQELGGALIGVDGRGIVDLEELREVLTRQPGASVVSVMLANNESGVIQPLADVVDVVRDLAPATLVHTDAVQGFAWVDVPAATSGVDLLSLSAHKFGGPQGVGLLVAKGDIDLHALIRGGGQERERRSGTQNVAGIAAMGVAMRETAAARAATVARVGSLRDRLVDGLLAAVPDTTESGVGPDRDRSHKVAGSAHLCFAGIESEALLFLLEQSEIYASAASSCASGAQEPSHVLAAMGVTRELAQGSLRLSLGTTATDADVDAALAAIPPAVERLRAFA